MLNSLIGQDLIEDRLNENHAKEIAEQNNFRTGQESPCPWPILNLLTCGEQIPPKYLAEMDNI